MGKVSRHNDPAAAPSDEGVKTMNISDFSLEDFREVSCEVKMWFPVPGDGEVNFGARIRPERIVLPKNLVSGLINYIIECLEKISGYSKPTLDGIVVGLSGGIDSSTVVIKGVRYPFLVVPALSLLILD